jgi:hypothetical protein
MKYVVIFAISIFLVRIDFWLGLLDKAGDRFAPEPVEINTSDIATNRELVGMGQDPALKRTTKETFFSLLEDFHSTPTNDIREKAISILKDSPAMFGPTLDSVLEANIFRWRELLNNNEPELVVFLLDLMNILQGENLLMVKRFWSLWMEINMEHFLAAYSRSKDSNCMIVTTFGDNIPEEEKLNEYYEREDALKAFLLVLGLEIAKRTTPESPTPDPNSIAPEPPAQAIGVSP